MKTANRCLAGGGETGRMLRSRDWTDFPIGSPEDWPSALRVALNIVLNSPEAMFLAWGPDLLFFHNDLYAPFLAVRPPMPPGSRFEDLWGDVWVELRPLVDRALSGEAVRHEDMYLSMEREGRQVDTWWSFFYSPIFDDNGNVCGIYCVTSETTERVRATAALAESERRFRNMADHSPLMMWVTEPDGRCVYLNRRWYEFTGQTVEQSLGYGWLEAIHPDDRKVSETIFLAANDARSAFSFEYRLRMADGAYRWTVDAASPRFAPDGEFLGYVGSVFDIDERKEAEEALRESEEHYRHAAELNPQTAWTALPDGRLDRIAERWSGWTGSDATGESWVRAMHPDDRERSLSLWRRSVATGEPFDIQHRSQMVDGRYRWMHSRAYPRLDEQGSILRWYGTTEDIDERKRGERHLVLMVNELNHRVKNTLATVQSLALQTFRDPEAFERSKQDFSNRLIALAGAHDILTARNWSRADLRDIVRRSISTCGDASAFDIEGPSIPVAPKTALALSMALHELCSNAARYGSLSRKQGRVTIRWRTEDAGEGSVRLLLDWLESGGPPVSVPGTTGFGSRFLGRGLSAELDATVDMTYEVEGFAFRFVTVVPSEPKDFQIG